MSLPLRRIGGILALAVTYAVAGRLGLKLDAVAGFATLVWPGTGLALAALIGIGPWLWPGVTLGALAVNLWIGGSASVALGIAVGNTLEAVVGAVAVRRLIGARGPFDGLREVLAFVFLAAGLAPLISAGFGVASLWTGALIPAASALSTGCAWWLGDALGALVITPVLLSWRVQRMDFHARPHRFLEGALLGVSLAALTSFVFGPFTPAGSVREFLLFPPLIWAALRFGPRGAALATLLASAIAIRGTAVGDGPFAGANLSASLSLLQSFMAIAAVTTLVLACAIAERDRAALDNGRLYAEAQQAILGREEILAIVSHDLKNPLAAVLSRARLIERKPPPDASEGWIREQTEGIRRSVKQMTVLIEALLDAESLGNGQITLKCEPVEARLLIGEAVEAFAPTAKTLGVELRAQPSQAESARVRADRARVFQIFSNLIGNALRYTPSGGHIEVSIALESSQAWFEVRDTGPGIPPSDQPLVFDRHWRGGDGGTGLGLFIVKQLVEAHAGAVRVQSDGAGSRFSFSLPREVFPAAKAHEA